MSNEQSKACQEREEQIVLYLWDELDPTLCLELEEHIAACPGCRLHLEREQQLMAGVEAVAPADPSPAFLAECRVALGQQMDGAGLPGFWTRLSTVLWPRGLRWSFRGWMTAHPAWSAAVFVLLGITLGGTISRLATTPPASAEQFPSGSVVVAEQTPLPVGEWNLTDIGLAEGASGPVVQLHGSTDRPQVVQGNLDDPRIRSLLMNVIQNGQRFTADNRMASVDLLQSLAGDPDVRRSLCRVARTDRNPAVRLKAIEALRGMEQDQQVVDTLLDALVRDSNPGVRIQAIDALRELVDNATGAPDQDLVRVLRERMEKDPSTYIRVQSAAAMQRLAERGVY